MENQNASTNEMSSPFFRTSGTITKIAQALIKAHNLIGHAVKDGTNPHLRNDYATLESVIDAVKKPLLDNEIVIIQFASKKAVVTRLQHSSGEYYENEMELIVNKNDMQGLGSAITYARRYSLASLLNISQKDDDGNLASGMKAKQAKVVEKKVITSKETDPF